MIFVINKNFFTFCNFDQIMISVILSLLNDFIDTLAVRTKEENMINLSSIYMGWAADQLLEPNVSQSFKNGVAVLGDVADIEITNNESLLPMVEKGAEID